MEGMLISKNNGKYGFESLWLDAMGRLGFDKIKKYYSYWCKNVLNDEGMANYSSLTTEKQFKDRIFLEISLLDLRASNWNPRDAVIMSMSKL